MLHKLSGAAPGLRGDLLRLALLLVVVILALVAVGLLVALAALLAPLLSSFAADQVAVGALGLGVAGFVVGAGWLAARRALYRAALILTAVWLPGLVAILTVFFFLVLGAGSSAEQLARDGLLATLFGLGLGVCAWLTFAVANQSLATSSFANSRSHSQLSSRLAALHEYRGNNSRIGNILDQIERILEQRDERWVVGTGYLDAWELLHRAEEARLARPDVQTSELVDTAHRDWLRLRGSNIPDAETLAFTVRAAVGYVAPDAYQYFVDPTGGATVQTPTNVTRNQRAAARQMIMDVRSAINVYREERYDRIVRARNQLVVTTIFTAIVGYLGLGLALLAGVPTTAVFAASAYFVVGATVGMLVRLRSDAARSVAMEDYGLSTARLLHTPLLSGIAAIAGVALIALAAQVGDVLGQASVALNSETAAATEPAAETGGADERTDANASELVRIFDVGRYPAGLIIAALFGFSPPLLLRGLQRHVDQYKLDLAASEPSGDGRGG
jgi:hypothetical protein